MCPHHEKSKLSSSRLFKGFFVFETNRTEHRLCNKALHNLDCLTTNWQNPISRFPETGLNRAIFYMSHTLAFATHTENLAKLRPESLYYRIKKGRPDGRPFPLFRKEEPYALANLASRSRIRSSIQSSTSDSNHATRFWPSRNLFGNWPAFSRRASCRRRVKKCVEASTVPI